MTYTQMTIENLIFVFHAVH